MPWATSPSAMPLTSSTCRPQNSAICSKVSEVLSTSQTAVALGIRGVRSMGFQTLSRGISPLRRKTEIEVTRRRMNAYIGRDPRLSNCRLRVFANFQHDFADMGWIVDPAVRLGRPIEAESRVDHRPYPPLGDQRPDALLYPSRYARLGFLRLGAQRRAGEREAPDHEPHQIDSDIGALEEGDLHNPPLECRRAQIAFDVVAAHHVEDHIGARAVGRNAHGLDEVLLAIIDGPRGAERKRDFGLPGA